MRGYLSLAAAAACMAACKPDESKGLLEPSEALGPIVAEEAMQAAGVNKKIALISHDDSWGPPSSVEQAFKAAVERQGYTTFVAKPAALGSPGGRGGAGLLAEDFAEALQKAADAGAIVSFAGAPLLGPNDAARLPAHHPPVIVIATARLGDQLGVPADPERLGGLLEAKVIQEAIVNGGSPSGAAISGRRDATHEMFARYYEILRLPP